MSTFLNFDWEYPLILWIQQIINGRPFLKGLFVLFTQFGEPYIPVILAMVLYLGLDKRKGIYTALCFVFPQLLTGQIKNTVKRRRPYMDNEMIECLHPADTEGDIYDIVAQGYSFPSGHATSISSMMCLLFLQTGEKIFRYLYFPVVFLVCLSRVALGVHYLSDVLAGALFGVVFACVFDILYKRLEKKQLYLFLFLLSAAGVFFCRSNDYFSLVGLVNGAMAGDLFEERFVGFENTKKPLKIVLRILFGAVLFLSISEGMKLSFAQLFLKEDGLPALLFRSFRYCLSSFAVLGPYTYLFRYRFFN